jgi:hypothetical protein
MEMVTDISTIHMVMNLYCTSGASHTASRNKTLISRGTKTGTMKYDYFKDPGNDTVVVDSV